MGPPQRTAHRAPRCRKAAKAALMSGSLPCLRNDELLPDRLRRCLHLPVLRLCVWKGRLHQRGNRRPLGHELTQQIKSLLPQSGAEKDHPGDVAARRLSNGASDVLHKADHRHRGLLRSRRERPCRSRAAEQREDVIATLEDCCCDHPELRASRAAWMQPNSSSLANGLPTAPHAHGAVANPGVRIGRNEYRGNAMAGRNQPAVQLQTLVLGIWTSRIKHAVPCTWSDRRNSSAGFERANRISKGLHHAAHGGSDRCIVVHDGNDGFAGHRILRCECMVGLGCREIQCWYRHCRWQRDRGHYGSNMNTYRFVLGS